MSKAKAAELELKLEPAPFGFYLRGVGGRATAEVATVKDFGIVGQSLKNVQFLVGGSDAGNGLIGRNLLAMADTEFDLANGSVKLISPHGCEKTAMAYWAAGKPFFTVALVELSSSDRQFNLNITINGAKIAATLDSGAPMSLISRSAAQKAGIDLNGPGVEKLNDLGGLGRRLTGGWSVPVVNVTIGDEQILKSRLVVIDSEIIGGIDSPDMLIGADFILAHHIYVARRQRMIYFTYSGGKPFLTPGKTPKMGTSVLTPLAPNMKRVVAIGASEPKTAADFARRGNARLTSKRSPEPSPT
ncbi:MAG: hypothetical protein JWO15_3251 [Sphingomonadales bacterium]|nr:hypothetical protein [Sphingomonadales bacterium]